MNILLIDGGQAFRFTEGRLNHTLHQTARETLAALGHTVKETVIEQAVSVKIDVAINGFRPMQLVCPSRAC